MDIYKIHFKEINIKNRVYNYCFDNLIKAKISKTTNFLIDEKSYKDLIISFAKYDRKNSIKMLTLHYHDLV